MSLLALTTLVTAWFAPALPGRLSIGALALVAASILLGQGLLRDLWLLWRSRQASRAPGAAGHRCLCVESGLGVLIVFAGVALLLGGVGDSVALSRVGWTLLVLLSLVTGYTVKDWVFEWNPWRLRREKDHASIIFSWRKK